MSHDIFITLIAGIGIILGFWLLFVKMDRPTRVFSIKVRNGQLVIEDYEDRPESERE